MIAEKVSSAATQAGAGTAVVFGLTPTEWSVIGVIGGLVIALAGLAFNAYFGWRRLKLDERKRGLQ